MYFYIKYRKSDNPSWRLLRDAKGIMVFTSRKTALEHAKALNAKQFIPLQLSVHPTNRRSPLYGLHYSKIGWNHEDTYKGEEKVGPEHP
ncbi:MAG: hypothetical protein ACOC32_00340 [Nanoarchaeota archaeon]